MVEDDSTIRQVLAYQLTSAGYQVDTAEDGLAALERVREWHPALVLLDLMLPRLAGQDVLRLLRAESDAAVIVLSARTGEPDKLEGFALGADDYVTKPFSPRELLARVDAVLRRVGALTSSEPPLSAEGAPTVIEVDRQRHEVRKHGRVVPLAPKEFELLAFLADHPRQVCSRDRILEAVWGYAYDGGTRTVDVHVHWLRHKLEDEPRRPRHLHTVRLYGYKFTPDPVEPEA